LIGSDTTAHLWGTELGYLLVVAERIAYITTFTMQRQIIRAADNHNCDDGNYNFFTNKYHVAFRFDIKIDWI
jgi:hypothetical protein